MADVQVEKKTKTKLKLNFRANYRFDVKIEYIVQIGWRFGEQTPESPALCGMHDNQCKNRNGP